MTRKLGKEVTHGEGNLPMKLHDTLNRGSSEVTITTTTKLCSHPDFHMIINFIVMWQVKYVINSISTFLVL